MDSITLTRLSKQTRLDIITMLEHGERGHVISAFSIVEILVILYHTFLKFDSSNPSMETRDRFILSKGHGCMALYSALARHGFFDLDEFKRFCKIDGILGGHPSRSKVPGIEVSTGSLGQGLAIAVGMAVHAIKTQGDQRVVALLGDGECNEGSVWEAALSASKNKTSNLIVIIDNNQYQSYGKTSEVCPLGDLANKWASFGFSVEEVDMIHAPLELKDKLELPRTKPLCIICNTIKGQGIPSLEGNLSWHHKLRPSKAELDQLRKQL